MSRSSINKAQIIYCSFPPPIPPSKFYKCYKKETCCDQGCCVNGPYQIYQVWYYWLLFLIVFGIIYGSSWLCSKPRSTQPRSVREVAASSHIGCSYSSFRCNRRRCAHNIGHASRINSNSTNRFNNNARRANNTNNINNNGINSSSRDIEDDVILDRLFVSFRNRNTFGDPPSYSSVVSSDYHNLPPRKFCPLYTCYGPPPTYNTNFNTNDPQNTNMNDELPNYESTVLASTNETQIQIHCDDRNEARNESRNISNATAVASGSEMEPTAPEIKESRP